MLSIYTENSWIAERNHAYDIIWSYIPKTPTCQYVNL